MGKEMRTLQADSDVDGGFLVTPEQFVQEVIQAIADITFMKEISRVIPLSNSVSLGVPTVETKPSDFDWTPEIGPVSEDTALKFGKRSLTPSLLSKLVKISMKLMNNSAIPVDVLVRDLLAEKHGLTQEKAFLTGSGSAQPLGVFTASGSGISTDRDVSTGNTTTGITSNGLMEVKYNLKAQYRANAQWAAHRDLYKKAAKLKDSDGQYMWKPGIEAGQPDMLLGFPVNESEHAPNTFTASQYVAVLGDFSKYWIAEVQSMDIQRLVELYAASNEIGFIGRGEVDGMPVDELAFSRMKLAAS